MTHIQAAQRLVNHETLTNVKYLNRKIKEPTDFVHPKIAEFYKRFNAALERRGIPTVATEFYRTPERQTDLYEAGRSLAKAGSSPHQWGCAVDIVHHGYWWELDEKEWAIIGALGKETARKAQIPIEWGGDWNFYDPAHWQLKHWKDVRELMLMKSYDQFTYEDWWEFQAHLTIQEERKYRASKDRNHGYYAWIEKALAQRKAQPST